MIRFECPGCQARYTVPDDKAGKVTRCSRCRAKFFVPAAPAVAPSSTPRLPTPPPLPPPPPALADPAPFAELAEDDDVEIAPCPKCDARLMVAERDVGSDVECPYCKSIYRAARPRPDPPRRRPVVDESEQLGRPSRRRDEDDDEEDEDRPRKKSKRRRPAEPAGPDGLKIALIAVAALTAVFGLFALVVPPVAIVIYLGGVLVSMVGGIWFLVIAFYDDAVQGLLCLFVPFYSLYYLITNFDACKRPFFVQLAGAGVVLVAAIAFGLGMALQR